MVGILNHLIRALSVVLLMTLLGITGASLWCRSGDTASAGTSAAPAAKSAAVDDDLVFAERLSRAYRGAARRVLPASVVIKAQGENDGDAGGCPLHGGGAAHGQAGKQPAAGRPALSIIGSGFIIDAGGIVLTNQHVIEDARGLAVKLADGREFPVVKVASDKEMDLAALKIQCDTPLPTVVMGDANAAEVGDIVLTIGSPMEMEQTVCAGIISAKNRTFCPNHDAKLLQTDAAIAPGSSGGAVVNLRGEVIGVATAMLSETESYSGIGFAVPIQCAKEIISKVGQKGK